MAVLVSNDSKKTYTIVTPQRLLRPADVKISETEKAMCPFCPGQEGKTPPEIFRIPKDSSPTSWQVRVFPNKFPFADIHEVIVHSPHHEKDIPDLAEHEMHDLLTAYRQRLNFYKNSGLAILFCNFGPHSGASLTHPHSQLAVLPFDIQIQNQIKEKVENIVYEKDEWVLYCPNYSEWPFEMWITKKNNDHFFYESTDEDLSKLTVLLQKAFQSLKRVSEDPSYDAVDHGVPFSYNYYISPSKDWFVRIIPRFIVKGGFELATGLHVNTVAPSQAAEILTKRVQ